MSPTRVHPLLYSCLFPLAWAWGAAPEFGIGNWTFDSQNAKGGVCTLVNSRQIRIQGFSYDGKGPEVWFMADVRKGREMDPGQWCDYREKNESVIIPDHMGQCVNEPGAVTDQDVVLTLPATLTWKDVDFVGIYSYKVQYLFGYVRIPMAAKSIDFDAYQGPELDMGDCVRQQDRILSNREPLHFTC